MATKILAYKRNKGRCFYCDKQVPKNEGHFDHFYPYSKGGKNTIDNIVWSCAPCNLSKSNHRLDVWLRRLPKNQALRINKVLKYRDIR